MDPKLASQSLYEHMRAETQSKQKLASLAILWEVLCEQRDRKSTDYSVALIARLTGARNGLKVSSIRNAAGAGYRQLIQLFAQESAERNPKASGAATRTGQDRLLSGIDDLAVRARVGVILSENRKLKTELDLIKNAIQRDYLVPEYKLAPQQPTMPVSALDIEPDRPSAPQGTKIEVIPPSVGLLQQEAKAVEHFISKENLDANGWVATDAGGLKRTSGQIVARPGFLFALRKALSGQR